LLVNSHADGTDSLPFYEGILSRVVHPTNLVALPEHRTLTVTAASLATVGGLSLILRAWCGTSLCTRRGWAIPRAGNRPAIRAEPTSIAVARLRLPFPLDSLRVSIPVWP